MSEPSQSAHTRPKLEPFGPLGQLIWDAMQAQSYSFPDAAEAIRNAPTKVDGAKRTTCAPSSVHRWIYTGAIPQPSIRRWISAGLHIPRDRLTEAVEAQAELRNASSTGSGDHSPAHAADHRSGAYPPTVYDPDEMLRRQFMERALVTLGGATAADLNSDLPVRLLRALTRPSTIDPATADFLDRRVSESWQTWSAQVLPSASFLPFVQDDLHRISTLLEGSLPAGIRSQLTAAAGGFAMLAGVLLWDMRSYGDSRSYLRIAAAASHVADRPTLGAVANGWMSFAWSYEAETTQTLTEALLSVKAAQTLPGVRSRIRLWLAAIEAEIHAKLGDHRACADALRRAEAAELLDSTSGEDEYWTHYDMALLAGFKGSCYLRLSRPHDAQTALTEALKLSSRQHKRARVLPHLFADLGRAYAMDGRVDLACEAGGRALDAAEARSVAHLRRLDLLMDHLESWSDAAPVRMLGERLMAIRQQR